MKENPPENPQDDPQQTQDTSDKLKPQQLMDMILLDARAYTIKYTAARKREERDIKQKTQDQLNDTVRLLELDDGQNKEYTDNLTEQITTLKDNIQMKMVVMKLRKLVNIWPNATLKQKHPLKLFVTKLTNLKRK